MKHFKYLTLITSISIAAAAAYFSIMGLATIFSGAFLSVVIMASILEVGKLVTATYLHVQWKELGVLVKSYLTTAVVVLMFITSMGIFGYLSKAHIEQSVQIGGTNTLQIETLERQVDNERRKISSNENLLSQLDETVNTLIEYDRIRGPEGALAVRESQAEQRNKINESIEDSFVAIEKVESKLLPLKRQQLELEVEVGPLKYVAELVYGESEAEKHFDKAVRWVIILIVIVFDPLAVMLLIVSAAEFKRQKKEIKPLIDETQIMRMNDDQEPPTVEEETNATKSDNDATETGRRKKGLTTTLNRRPI